MWPSALLRLEGNCLGKVVHDLFFQSTINLLINLSHFLFPYPQISEGNDSSQADSVLKPKKQITINHTDIIGDSFWSVNQEILSS